MGVYFSEKGYWIYPVIALLERLRLKHESNLQKILIYQMGKVGSSTIYETIRNINVSYSLSHVHFLSEVGIDKAEQIFRETSLHVIPMHLRKSKILRKCINIESDKLKIITLTREPIGRMVSSVFHNLSIFNPECVGDKGLNVNGAINLINQQLRLFDPASDFATNWFDYEFSTALNLNIYDYPFNQDKGYSVIKAKNFEILVMQVESLNFTLEIALKEFLGYENNIPIITANVGENKQYSDHLKFVKKSILLNSDIIDFIYNTKYMKHFYSREAIKSFKNNWLETASMC